MQSDGASDVPRVALERPKADAATSRFKHGDLDVGTHLRNQSEKLRAEERACNGRIRVLNTEEPATYRLTKPYTFEFP